MADSKLTDQPETARSHSLFGGKTNAPDEAVLVRFKVSTNQHAPYRMRSHPS